MDLKNLIISVDLGSGVGKKTGNPYTCADILFKGENGMVVNKRIFFQDFEKKLLNIA